GEQQRRDDVAGYHDRPPVEQVHPRSRGQADQQVGQPRRGTEHADGQRAGVQGGHRDEGERDIGCRTAALAHRLPEPQQPVVTLPQQAGSVARDWGSAACAVCPVGHLSYLDGREYKVPVTRPVTLPSPSEGDGGRVTASHHYSIFTWTGIRPVSGRRAPRRPPP